MRSGKLRKRRRKGRERSQLKRKNVRHLSGISLPHAALLPIYNNISSKKHTRRLIPIMEASLLQRSSLGFDHMTELLTATLKTASPPGVLEWSYDSLVSPIYCGLLLGGRSCADQTSVSNIDGHGPRNWVSCTWTYCVH